MSGWNACEPLGDHHQLEQFSCGESSIDEWCSNGARKSHASMLCRIWVSMGAGGQVAGFFTLSNHTVSGLDLPGKDRGTSGTIPATLIGKLAMRQDLRKQGLGSLLLQDALERAVMGANYSSSRLIVLDAANEKVMGWYKAHSFKSFSQATPLRMYMKMSTADAMVKALRS